MHAGVRGAQGREEDQRQGPEERRGLHASPLCASDLRFSGSLAGLADEPHDARRHPARRPSSGSDILAAFTPSSSPRCGSGSAITYALLVLFMVDQVEEGGLGFTDANATAIYGLYTAAVYLACTSWWMDCRPAACGAQRAVWWGGRLDRPWAIYLGVPRIETFFLGLIFVVLGNGVAQAQCEHARRLSLSQGGARRDAGFSIFYMGINLGAFIGPLVCSYLGEKRLTGTTVSRRRASAWCSGSCSIDTATSTSERQGPYARIDGREAQSRAIRQVLIAIAAVAAVLVGLFVFANVTVESAAKGTGVVIVSSIILYFAAVLLWGGLTAPEKRRTVVIFIFFLASSLFWAGYEQAGSSLNLFASRLTDRMIGGWELPASTLQSIPPWFVITLSPVFSWLWLRSPGPRSVHAGETGLRPRASRDRVRCHGRGLCRRRTGEWTGFRCGGWSRQYFLHTVGELCLSPDRAFECDEARSPASGGADDGHVLHGQRPRKPHRRT